MDSFAARHNPSYQMLIIRGGTKKDSGIRTAMIIAKHPTVCRPILHYHVSQRSAGSPAPVIGRLAAVFPLAPPPPREPQRANVPC